uniref:Cytohesin 1 n=2 Tax=Neoaves TaxID=3078114 RepID=A0A8C3J305_9CHAR
QDPQSEPLLQRSVFPSLGPSVWPRRLSGFVVLSRRRQCQPGIRGSREPTPGVVSNHSLGHEGSRPLAGPTGGLAAALPRPPYHPARPGLPDAEVTCGDAVPGSLLHGVTQWPGGPGGPRSSSSLLQGLAGPELPHLCQGERARSRDAEQRAAFAPCGLDAEGPAPVKVSGLPFGLGWPLCGVLCPRGGQGDSQVPPGCSEPLCAPQEKHAEEQAGGHGQEEVQHGSQEGTAGRAGGERGSSATPLGPCWALPSWSRCLATHGGRGRASTQGRGWEEVGKLAGSAASPRARPLAPLQGIQFLIENDLLKNTCEDIAQFLYKGEGLNKTAIGDYLGERDEFNIQVLHAFVELHEFTDLNLVQALRQFLWSFRLPGEAQKIDRMMEAFAQRYCQCNPGVFQSTDTCYVLSFAIIMLNTSLHNPNVKDKPTAERFIAMNRGINDGGDLPEELLRNLYESIKNEPFKIPEDDGNDLTHTFFNPDREGWLLKLAGGRVKTWKRRWFILTDNCLYYFEYTTDKEPRGIIPLENLSIREVEDSKKPNCFELYIPDNKDQVIKACKTEADGRVVEGNHTVYRISAPTTEEKEEWIKCIKAAISRDPFYEMLAARKKKVSSTKRH